MRILLAHNYYRQSGGEDAVFQHEKALLEQHGHSITLFERSNDAIESDSVRGRLNVARKTIWNQETLSDLADLIDREQPEIAHFTNAFPLISPSAYYACQRHNVPVLQTVQNYRLICPKASLMREGKICERCIGKQFAWPSLVHRCYHDSVAQTGVIASMLTYHKLRKTWQRQVNRYIAATEFSRKKLISGGLPQERIVVKPNFLVQDPGEREQVPGHYVLFVGRLAAEKGVRTLIEAWQRLPDIPLKIIGDGPLYAEMAQTISERQMTHVELLGWHANAEVLVQMKGARYLIFPSQWYEGFPVTIVEAFASGLPVAASDLGGMAEVVTHGATGLLFQAGNVDDLVKQASALWKNPEESLRFGKNARRTYLAKYTAERNYRLLMKIYGDVLSQGGGSGAPAPG